MKCEGFVMTLAGHKTGSSPISVNHKDFKQYNKVIDENYGKALERHSESPSGFTVPSYFNC